jgi:hypothetical protein
MNVLDMVADMVKLTLSVCVAVWIRETGSGPPTQLRANSESSRTREPDSYVYGHLKA